ncbi:MAG: DnaJ domain-containing protein [Clostridiales bacterium]|nr:DnaJ domain-containing protein [Clostridiales bacterium]
MPQDKWKQDEIKRKLRELKKLEIKLRSNSFDLHDLHKDYIKNNREFKDKDLVWNKFFDLKSETTQNARYSIYNLIEMTKDEFKDVIIEYFYYVYYSIYKENAFADYSMIDTEIFIYLGLPVYADHDEIKKKFRELAKKYHPDNGGDSTMFMELMKHYKNIKS